jgi:hypothetical protein
MPGFIERSQWKTFLDEFSKRNQLRTTRLEVVNKLATIRLSGHPCSGGARRYP